MKSALLAQNDNLVIENIKQNVGRSVFDLSHSTTFPIDVDGAILPVCCIETVPSDSFEISCECLLRQLSPLTVPLMATFRLNTAWFYCDNRVAWKKWDRFMTGGRSGNDVYDIPRVANCAKSKPDYPTKYALSDTGLNTSSYYANINLKNNLHTYFGISMNNEFDESVSYGDFKDYSSDLPIAFPFFDYQLICRDYYTDIDRLPENYKSGSDFYNYDDLVSDWSYSNLFPVDDDEIRLVDGVQIRSGFKSGDDSSSTVKGFILDKVRYHDVRPDYFTSSKKAPMRGDAPTISTSVSTITLPSGTAIKITDNNLINIPEKNVKAKGTSNPSSSPAGGELYLASNNSSNAQFGYDSYPDHDKYNLVTEGTTLDNITGVTDGDITLEGSFAADITASDLLLVSQLTQWKILNMLHEPYYNDFLNAHFDNVRVGESEAEKPQYIGGTSQLININEILQTSQTTTGETGSPLGNQGAVAMSLANNYVGKYYCNNYGYIIGVAYIITDMYYEPALPRWSSRRTKEDFYSPEFANLSMQATLNKEIFFSSDDDWNDTPWGYTGSFDELRSIPNRIAGDLLNDSYTDLKSWVIRREMSNDNKPSMSTKWLSLKGNVDKTYIWSAPSMPAFMLQCANYIKAVRPMPKVAIPKAL